jgi:hypothetical protein
VVFYEMLTGQLPVGRFQPPSQKIEVDVRLDKVVLRALEREPERRYQQVSEVRTSVEAIAEGSRRGGVALAAMRPSRRGISLAILLLLVVTGAILAFSQRGTGNGGIETGQTLSADGAVTYLNGHTSIVKAVAVSSDGHTLGSAGFDGRVIVRDLPGGNVVEVITSPTPAIDKHATRWFSLALSPDGKSIYAGGNSQLLQSGLRDNSPRKLFRVSNGGIRAIMPYDQGRRLACVAGGGSELVFHDVAEGRGIATVPIYPGKVFGNVRATAASPDGRFIAVTTSDLVPTNDGAFRSSEPCKLTVFDTTGTERLSWQFNDYADFSFARVVFLDPEKFVVCLPSGQMLRWTLDAETNWQQDAQSLRISPGRYTASTASPDGSVIWLAENRQIVGLSTATGQLVAFVDLQIGDRRDSFSSFPIEAIVATGEPNTVAAALWDGRVALARCHPREDSTASMAPSEEP